MKILYLPDEYSQQRQFEKPVDIYPVLMAMEAEYYCRQGHDVAWGEYSGVDFSSYDKILTKAEGLPFLDLPRPDRIFTNAFDHKYQVYGNYKYHPATHMLVADGCWHGKCTFCVERKKEYKVRSIDSVMQELYVCDALGFREIFDDSGTFPTGEWLDAFCSRVKKFQFMKFGCNMRIDGNVDFKQMKDANFRMLLFGLESANQKTLDRLNKGVKADDFIKVIKKAAKAGLEPHIAGMVGYPWETREEAGNTIELFKYLLIKGYAKTAQMSLYSPAGMSCGNEHYRKHKNYIYDVAFHPSFWYNKIKDIKSLEDVSYLVKNIKKGCVGLWEGTKHKRKS